MKKVFTLATASVLAAASLSAEAQVAVDGVLNANEITAGNYVLIGKYTNPRGFGDYGLLSLYAASTATKVYFFLGGTVQNNGNAFQLYMDLPAAGGVPAGTVLPGASAGTSFEKMVAKMDLPVDMALALRATAENATDFKIEAASYTNATTAASKKVTADAAPLLGDGTALTLPVDAAFPMLAGARVAYRNSSDGKVLTNPGNTTPNTGATYGAAGSFGWEIELDRTAIGALTGTPALTVFALQNGGDGGFLSSDFIPQTSTPLTTNNGNLAEATGVDFGTIAGRQAATLNLTATGVTLANRGQVAKALRFGVYPNPGSAVSVDYVVPQGKQNVTLSVIDATGKQVRSVSAVQAGSQSYKLRNLSAGLYVVKLNVGGQQTSGKVVIE
ncbi:T9SS type A sorting domain-containing protein [uncultured Hymenobacter sp.]|uniref:T9SS type A sorting domain-containing protein n=1 Tax=uncultured Hymenobacter sp. TaxID=170016 RepID=UPI0035C9CDC4